MRAVPRRPGSGTTLSVCLPTYNGERFLEASLNSVLAQEELDFEFIIVDDASEDGTVPILKGLVDDRVRLYRNSKRLGLVGNWNRCLSLASGDLICIWHQDDIMLPGNLSEKRAAFAARSDLGLVYSAVEQIDEFGHRIPGHHHWASNNPPTDRTFPRGSGFDWLFGQENIICCPSVLMRRACYLELGGFDERLPFCADWEMWMRIALFNEIGYVSRPLVAYRWHDDQETSRVIGTPEHTRQRYMARHLLLRRFGMLITDSKARSHLVRREMGEEALREAVLAHSAGRRRLARDFLFLAFRLNPRLTIDARARVAARSIPGERLRYVRRRWRAWRAKR